MRRTLCVSVTPTPQERLFEVPVHARFGVKAVSFQQHPSALVSRVSSQHLPSPRYRCKAQQGEDAEECVKYAKYYRSVCPTEWVTKWNEEREAGTWPGRY